jgi:hypothetical protein
MRKLVVAWLIQFALTAVAGVRPARTLNEALN